MALDSVQMPASVNNGPNSEQAHEKQTPQNNGGASKKKKVNRSAKLKQYKLDARREQWLSQGKNKGPAQHNGDLGLLNDVNKVGFSQVESTMCSEMDSRSSKSSNGEDNEGSSVQESDNEFAVNSPQDALKKEARIQRQQRPGSSSSSSCSGCISEDEDGSLDDWEAVADALNLNEHSLKLSPEKVREETPTVAQFQTKTCFSMEAENKGILKPEYKIKPLLIPNRIGQTGNGRAWRHDDVSRPISLPSLSKQHSFPTQSGRLSAWASTNRNEPSIPSAMPTSCPICYEDLDVTDSNFAPCACGFHLCLFCHKRIVELDGRCPSCRKQYAPIDVGTIDVGINVSAFSRLSHSCSMRSSA